MHNPLTYQHISGISTTNGSQSFVGTATGNVYFVAGDVYSGAASEGLPEASSQAARRCCRSLFLTDPYVDRQSLINAKGTRVDGTCEWITCNESYRAWVDGSPRPLWISGGPGKGKTMLSIFLTEELERRVSSIQDTGLIFYFCSHQDEKRNTAVAVLRGLVHQILTKRPELVKHALEYFDTSERTQQTLSSSVTLWIIFSKLVEDPSLGTMFCVLDGVDECDKALKALLPKLVSLLSTSSSPASMTFRLAIVSRYMSGIQGCTRVKIDPDNNQNVASDIERFISTRVDELSKIDGFNNAFRVAVQTTLLARAEGTFLWVGFAMHELLQKQTCSEVLEALECLPSDLPSIYSRMLLKIPAERREISASILLWVTMAQYPLRRTELAAAVGVQSSSPLITTDQAISDEITLCGPILKVQWGLVTLVHQSARDYLLRKGRDTDTSLEMFRFELEKGHLKLARGCLDYIAQTKHADFRSYNHASPLLHYAALYWPEHAKSCSSLAVDLFDPSMPFFQKHSSLRKHWWGEYIQSKVLDLPTSLPLLHIACYLGIIPWVEAMLHRKSFVNWFTHWFHRPIGERDENGRTALHLAADGGQEAVVHLLVNLGADPKLDDNYRRTALHLAAMKTNEEMVQLLVSLGVGPNLEDLGKKTALHLAAMRSNKTILQLLVNLGADTHAVDDVGSTALHLAAWRGQVAVVRQLLDLGSDINTINGQWQTPLHVATLAENRAVMRLLVSSGIDIEAKDKHGLTALSMAAMEGNEEIVQLLLDLGAQADARDRYRRTALQIAIENNHEAVVQVLELFLAD